jgi:tetratricopeptide (TPR) repeat protein
MDSLENRAEAAEEAGDLQTALDLWGQLVSKHHEVAFLLRYGSVARELEKWEDAERALADAVRLEPSSSLVAENMGLLWYCRTDEDKDKSLETAKIWFLKGLSRDRNARALTLLGAIYLALDDNVAARHALEEAIQIDPGYEEALYNLAMAEEEGADAQKSVELLERAIQIDPEYSIAHQQLGVRYHRLGDLIRAEYHYRRSLEIDPADYWSNLYLANLSAVLGRLDEAEEMYRFATNLHPEIAGGLELFANFLESIGKDEETAEARARAKSSE